MSKFKYDYMIIGAGFAGLSLAHQLLKKKAGSVCIIDKEPRPALAASGRNASMICQIVRDPQLCEIMIESTQIIQDQWREDFSTQIPFQACGSLHIGTRHDMDLLETSLNVAKKHQVSFEIWDHDQVTFQYPFLKQAEFDVGLWCPSDGVIDIVAMAKALENEIQSLGAEILYGKEVFPIKEEDYFSVSGWSNNHYQAKVLINAAGAWVDEMGNQLGVQKLDSIALRRHIYQTRPNFLGEQTADWPIVWDMTQGIYLRPDGESLLLCPCDEDRVNPGPTFVEPHVYNDLDIKLLSFLPQARGFVPQRSWSGIRTFSKDRKFVIGWDSKVENFFWLSCLGGYGMTASARVGEIASEILLSKKPLAAYKYLSPDRFNQPILESLSLL